MSVLTVTELGTHLDMDAGEITAATVQLQRALDTAELTLAEEMGVSQLERLSTSDDIEVKTSRNTIHIRNGHVHAITALTINGVAVSLAKISKEYFTVAYSEGFARGGLVVVSYDLGFLDSDEMPAKMVRAILELAEWMYSGYHKGRTKTSEHMADWSATYSSEKGGMDIPATPRRLVSAFKATRI